MMMVVVDEKVFENVNFVNFKIDWVRTLAAFSHNQSLLTFPKIDLTSSAMHHILASHPT
jgi:hypothetical protein